jgi:hypothetical protein
LIAGRASVIDGRIAVSSVAAAGRRLFRRDQAWRQALASG